MKKKILGILSLSLMSLMSAQAQYQIVQQVGKNADMVTIPFTRYLLDNGLNVIIHEDKSDPMVHVDVTYHVGSAREDVGKSGFAHFFEHMMFQGSDNVGDEEHFRIITEAGGTLNGTTNRDRTNYFETVPKNQLEKMLWLEADRMGFFLDAVTQEKFEVQRATVKNERAQRYDNRPYGLVYEKTSENLYPFGHPYSWMTIGYVEDLNRVGVEDLKNFFLRWYGPNNALLTIGGDVNKDEVMKLVVKYFGSIPSGPRVETMPVMMPKLSSNRYVTMSDNFAKIPMLRVVYPGPERYSEEETALDCLAEIIGQGNNSTLYQKLVKSQKAVSASSYFSSNELSGEFTISMLQMGKHSLNDMYEELAKVWERIEKEGISQEAIDRFKASGEARMLYRLESVGGKVGQLADFYTIGGNANLIGRMVDDIRKLTPEKVMAVYNKYIKNKGALVLSLTTKDQPNNVVLNKTPYVRPTSGTQTSKNSYAGLKYVKAQDDFDRSVMPNANGSLSIPALNFWRVEDNSIQYIGSKLDELPIVNLKISLPGGRMCAPKGMNGLAALYASMMSEGTLERSAEDFAKELELLGGSIYVAAHLDEIVINVKSLKKNIKPTMALVEEMLTKPKMDNKAFERLKAQSLEAFNNNITKPEYVADNIFYSLVYGTESSLGRMKQASAKSLKKITIEDIKSYHKNNVSAKNARVVAVGDLEKQEALDLAAFLKKLQFKEVKCSEGTFVKKKTATKPTIYFVEFPGAAQTQFRVGYRTNQKYDGSGTFFKSQLANFPLGGTFNSRLNLYLRENKGWTYGAKTAFSGNKYNGTFRFSSGIKADATDSALYAILDIIEAYKKSGIANEELAFTKKSLLQREARAYETSGQKVSFLNKITKYELPENLPSLQTQVINNVTPGDLNKIIEKQPSPNEYVILLVGDKKHLSEKTKKKFDVKYLKQEAFLN